MAISKAKASAPKMAGLTATKKAAPKKAAVKKAATKATTDLIIGTSNEIESLTKVKALKLAPELLETSGHIDFRVGGVLTKIQEESWWDNGTHASFKEYVEAVLGIKYRKAMYLSNIYDKLTEAGVRWNDVKNIGWSKLRFITNHLTKENAKEWATRCKELNALELQDYVFQLENGDKEPSNTDKGEITVKKKSTMSFKVHDDQKEMIREALDKKKEEMDTEYDAVALEHICMDYVNGNAGKPTKAKVTKAGVAKYLKTLGQEDAVNFVLEVYPDAGEEDEEAED